MRITLSQTPSQWLLFALGDRAWLKAGSLPVGPIVDPDRTLIDRAGRGDRQAFTELYRRHVDGVHRRLSHLIGPDPEREDLVQQIFLDVFRSSAGFRGESSFSTWLYRIIVNVAYEHLRKSRRRALTNVPTEELEFLPSPGLSPEAAARQQQQVAAILALLDRLKPKKRIAFVLRVVEGLSLEEIAEIVGARAPAVGQRVRQAQREIVLLLERQERREKGPDKESP
jgi:RNA polymerase sigma-70 factor (ECF subfamily)